MQGRIGILLTAAGALVMAGVIVGGCSSDSDSAGAVTSGNESGATGTAGDGPNTIAPAGAGARATECVAGQTLCAGSCVDTATSNSHCGQCSNACPPATSCVDGTCSCQAGTESCGAQCVNLLADPANCGGCGIACAASQGCVDGICACPAGAELCALICVNTATDINNCGACGLACTVGQLCEGGACQCQADLTNCAGSCVHLASDAANCGACALACPPGQVCSLGICTSDCAAGLVQCGQSCVDVTSNVAHCGACNIACASGQFCTAGVCGCAAGQTLCDGQCVNTSSDLSHCGACGQACVGGQACTNGVCTCPAGQQLCGSSCVDLASDLANCGSCGNQCAAGAACVAGACIALGTGGSGGSESGATGGAPAGGSGGSQAGGSGGSDAVGSGGTDAGGSGGVDPANAGSAGLSEGTGGEPSAGGTGGSTGGTDALGGTAGSTGGEGGAEATGGAAGSAGTPSTDPPDPEPCEPVPAGQVLAFPGAEGFGRFSPGGRGGDVCHVTNLNDSGAGSLRDCVSQSNRTVVFEVGGWITLASNLGITQNNLTIAGQTAPGGGVGVRGRKFSVGGDNIIIRFFRARRGIIATTDRDDTMTVSSAASNVIVDHCSIAFGTDENFSMPGDEAVGPQDYTLQWSVVAYGLQRNNHSAGSLLTASNTTMHHSLYAFNKTRNPKARSEDERVLDFVNNVVYGWNAPDPYGESQGWSISGHPFIMGDTANGMHFANAVGNYFVSEGSRSASQAFVAGGTNADGVPTYNMFFEGNLLDGNANGVLDVSADDWGMVGTATQLSSRLTAPQVCTDDAATALERVLNGVGASVPARDELEAGLVQSIRNQGGILIQDESGLGIGADGYGTLAAGTAPPDGDRDGMPDTWETERGLNPSDAADRNGDDDGDGYTNLEEYLNQLAAPAWDV